MKEINNLIKVKSSPIDLADTTLYKTWMYIEERKIVIVHEIWDKDCKYIRTDQIKIPKRKLLTPNTLQ